MTPSVTVALANLERPRRWETEERQPFVSAAATRDALTDSGLDDIRVVDADLPGLARLTRAVSSVADALVAGAVPARRHLTVINESAASSTATVRAVVDSDRIRAETAWHDPRPIALLARLVIDELAALDATRFKECAREACRLVFYDKTRSRTQRWHADQPCGLIARQQRHRSLMKRESV